jgi:hypothetical protein
MEFAITFKGDINPKRTIALCKQAEVGGFKYAWFFDSHVLWRECYATIAMCIEHTDSLRFAPRANPESESGRGRKFAPRRRPERWTVRYGPTG